jgi:ribosomal protein S18 acetylase RimI-like enzyme
MVTFRTLTGDDFDAVVAAFNEAFSDYAVRFSMTALQLREIDGDRLVGFTLNGFDGETAYDSGTGVIPSHRRQGLASGMMEYILPVLCDAGARQYLLEVIESNSRAIALYESLGFKTTREFTSGSSRAMAAATRRSA